MIPRIWHTHTCEADRAGVLARELEVSDVTARLLAIRGLHDLDEARRFLAPSLDHLLDPFRLADMERAVVRLERAIAARERIAVHGDYDVDGITSTVILRRSLELLGADVVHFVPERLRDGYGLQPATFDRLKAEGVQVVVSVDCGIRGADAARRARELGVDLIRSPRGTSLPAKIVGAIILVHGRDNSRTNGFVDQFVTFAGALRDAGFSVMMIDLRGHGQSADSRYYFGIQERRDILGAVDWLQGRGYQAGSIGVLGYSLGAASVIGAASEEPAIGAIWIDSAYADIKTVIEGSWKVESGLPLAFLHSTRLMARLLYGFDFTASRPVDEIGRIAPRPIFMTYCRRDPMVRIAHCDRLLAARPGCTDVDHREL